MGIKSLLKRNKWLFNRYHNYCVRHMTTKYTENQKRFMDLNRKIWDSQPDQVRNTGSNSIILVRFTTAAPDAFWSVMKKAKAYQEKYGYQIHVIMDGRFKDNRNIASLIESYGVDKFIFHDAKNRKLEIRRNRIEAERTAKGLYTSDTDIMTFIESSINGVKVGDLIYDGILRSNGICTLKRCDQQYWGYVVSAIEEYYFYKRLFADKNVKVFITNEYAYIAGIAIRAAVANGLIAECISEYGEHQYTKDDIFTYILDVENRISPEELSNKIKEDSAFRDRCEDYFNKRMTGQISVADAANAYVAKRNLTADQLKEQLHIDKSKKTVLIAPHVFSDACHVYQHYIFRDYYNWLEYTLLNLKDRDDLNILFRPHPSAAGYGQFEIDGLNYLKTLVRGGIIQVPDDISTALVLEIADTVLTCGGTIGLEAACLGIPTVNTCKSYYTAFGVVDVKRTKEDYKDYLDHITEYRKSNDHEKMLLAKALLYLSNEYRRDTKVNLWDYCVLPGDDMDKLIEKQYMYLNEKLLDAAVVKDQEYQKWLQEL